MLFVRFLVLVLVLVFFAFALAGTVTLPIYSYHISNYNQDGHVRVSLWMIDVSKVTVSGVNATEVPSSEPVRINYAGCHSFRSVFRAMQALSIAGTIFGFYSFLISCLQCFCRLKVKFPLFLFVLLAFLCEGATVVLGGVAYSSTFCKGLDTDGNLTAVVFKGTGFKLDVGFILQIVAAAGYLITFIITPFTQELWCGKC